MDHSENGNGHAEFPKDSVRPFLGLLEQAYILRLPMLALLRRNGLSSQDAEDVFQQVVTRLFVTKQTITTYDSRRAFFSWLARVMLNAATDFCRQQACEARNRAPVLFSDADSDIRLDAIASKKEDPAARMSNAEFAKALDCYLDQLNDDQRKIFVDRMDNPDGAMTDRFVGNQETWRWRFYAARDHMKKMLEGEPLRQLIFGGSDVD